MFFRVTNLFNIKIEKGQRNLFTKRVLCCKICGNWNWSTNRTKGGGGGGGDTNYPNGKREKGEMWWPHALEKGQKNKVQNENANGVMKQVGTSMLVGDKRTLFSLTFITLFVLWMFCLAIMHSNHHFLVTFFLIFFQFHPINTFQILVFPKFTIIFKV